MGFFQFNLYETCRTVKYPHLCILQYLLSISTYKLQYKIKGPRISAWLCLCDETLVFFWIRVF